METPKKKKKRNRLIPVTAWEYFYPWPSTSGLRHLIFHADKNGFDKVLRHVGRRVLIHEREFFRWVEEQNPQAQRVK